MRRAIVVGGSLAGMCAARALADVFDEVLVIDRDHYPTVPQSRAGVPQSRHAHVLLERGKQELETLFPGFAAAMQAAGAESDDPGLCSATRRAPGWQHPGPTDTQLLFSSRDLLEFTVRSLLRARSNVRLVERTQMLGLQTTGQAWPRVSGVTVRDESGAQMQLDASLVLDATGRSTRADSWLQALGVASPVCERVDAHVGYASRWYRAPQPRPRELSWKVLWLEWEPPTLPRAGAIFPVEGDRWLATVAGIGPDRPPIDEQGFVEFTKRLSSPALARALALATPLSEVSGNRQLANVFRRYDEWTTRLPGFLALGDSVCAFNPLYGQGMSVAAACAGLLRTALQRDDSSTPAFASRFFRRQAAFVRGPWRLATGADFVWPTTEGKRPPKLPLLSPYLKLALQQAHKNSELRRHINPVFNLTGSMALFFEPKFVGGVFLSAFQHELHTRLHGREAIPEMPPASSATPPSVRRALSLWRTAPRANLRPQLRRGRPCRVVMEPGLLEPDALREAAARLKT